MVPAISFSTSLWILESDNWTRNEQTKRYRMYLDCMRMTFFSIKSILRYAYECVLIVYWRRKKYDAITRMEAKTLIVKMRIQGHHASVVHLDFTSRNLLLLEQHTHTIHTEIWWIVLFDGDNVNGEKKIKQNDSYVKCVEWEKKTRFCPVLYLILVKKIYQVKCNEYAISCSRFLQEFDSNLMWKPNLLVQCLPKINEIAIIFDPSQKRIHCLAK